MTRPQNNRATPKGAAPVFRWHRLGSLNDCEYAVDGDPNPKMPYGYVGPVDGGWEAVIWHPKRRAWFGIVGVPFSRVKARRNVEYIVSFILLGKAPKPVRAPSTGNSVGGSA